MKSEKSKRSTRKLSKSTSESPGHLTTKAESSYRLAEWIGAMTIYVLSLGQKPFDHYYRKKFERRNFIVGYLVYLFVIFLVLGFFVIQEMKNQNFL